ncbi:endoplasmic reticulum oxidoreductin 1 [Butyriboletus roseoflavus]|nr:endoplasmic reticulum oxidoreductin 1 [Butyriboletus roseoflavus]
MAHPVLHRPLTQLLEYRKVDLYRECPYWQENGFCMNRECGITTVDESEIPEKWRAAALSTIDLPPEVQRVQLPGCYYRDSDFCFLDDLTEGDYVDLTLVPERYTGYSGHSAHRVWRAIYEENCFGLSELNLLTGKSAAPVTLPDTLTDVLREPLDGQDIDEECLEKRVYYKIISGLHASISTHICTEWLNQSTGEWAPNLECFVTRVASHPERLQYIYFNTVLLLRAVARLAPYLSEYDYCSLSGNSLVPHHHSPELEYEVQTLARLDNVMSIAMHVGKFDEGVLFRGANANILKDEFKRHFRNVSRIMDCIGCDKCRLWGKVQTTGLATALKVLFEMDENALHESLHAVEYFREMWKKTGETDSARLIHEAERAVAGNVSPFLPRGFGA